ncbi:hypothetical protein HK098_000754 [Nowakowskiella sp. JEL0407]|nr:hypothetical protein HK098_000754 [Nowakowskiella sp. JEL0407]
MQVEQHAESPARNSDAHHASSKKSESQSSNTPRSEHKNSSSSYANKSYAAVKGKYRTTSSDLNSNYTTSSSISHSASALNRLLKDKTVMEIDSQNNDRYDRIYSILLGKNLINLLFVNRNQKDTNSSDRGDGNIFQDLQITSHSQQPSQSSAIPLPTLVLPNQQTSQQQQTLSALGILSNGAANLQLSTLMQQAQQQQQQDLFLQQQLQQQQIIANQAALAQTQFGLNAASVVAAALQQQQQQQQQQRLLSAKIEDSQQDSVPDYRGLLTAGQLNHQIVRQIFQTPITPLDLDPNSPFSVPYSSAQSISNTTQQQRIRDLSTRYTDNLDRVYAELALRNATLGISKSNWEKIAQRQYCDLASFHPESILKSGQDQIQSSNGAAGINDIPLNLPGLQGLRVKLTPDQTGALRISIVDTTNLELQSPSPLSALATNFSSVGLTTPQQPQQQQHSEIKSFASWSRAWSRYSQARTILYSEDAAQLRNYHDIICGYAEQYNWSDVQRFDSARRTVHAADARDVLTNDIPTIRLQCFHPESRVFHPDAAVQPADGSNSNSSTSQSTKLNNSTLLSPLNISSASKVRGGPSSAQSHSSNQSPRSPSVSNYRNNNSSSSSIGTRDRLRGPTNPSTGRYIPQSGSINNIQICGEFNGRRGCSRKTCSYLHICAVCSGTDHGRSLCSKNPLKNTSPYPTPMSNNRSMPGNLSGFDSQSSSQQQDQHNSWRIMGN